MKNYSLIIMLSFLTHSFVLCQCFNGISDSEIRNDHRSTIISRIGVLDFEGFNSNTFYSDGDVAEFSLGFAKAVWVGGVDPSGNLKIAANTYAFGVATDYDAGPIPENLFADESLCEFYNRVWIVKASEIVYLKYIFEQNGSINFDQIPEAILTWPAKGNPWLNEFAPNEEMAPFNDFNNDGIYNPLDGDLPIALTENPDFIPFVMRFTVYNDNKIHRETQGEPLLIEFHQLDYLLNCSTDSELENVLFTRLKYIYKGVVPLNNFRLGIWDDTDFGCLENDRIGCDTLLNCTYVYNANGIDDDCSNFETPVPQDRSAIRTNVYLNQDMSSYIYYNRPGFGSPSPQTTGPNAPLEYYNYLKGLWRSEDPLTVGGTGFNLPGPDLTNFAFPNLPTGNGWSMERENLAQGDFRTLTSFGLPEILPNQIGVLDFADYVLYDSENLGLAQFDVFGERVTELKEGYQNLIDGAFTGCNMDIEVCVDDCIWPGDINKDGIVTGPDIVLGGVFVGANETEGIARDYISYDWFPYAGDNWDYEILNIDAKFADVNGNGVINSFDLRYVESNFLKYNVEEKTPRILGQKEDVDKLISNFSKDEIDLENLSGGALVLGRLFDTDISLSLPNETLINPVHGLSFELKVDTSLVKVMELYYFASSPFEIDEIYYGTVREAPELGYILANNRVHCYYTNTNGEDMNEGITFTMPPFSLRDDARTSNPDGKDTIVFQFQNVFAMNAEGEVIELSPQYDSIFVNGLEFDPNFMSGVSSIPESRTIHIYPNPSSTAIQIDLDNLGPGEVTIYDLNGKSVYSKSYKDSQINEIDVYSFASGIYIVKFVNLEGEHAIGRFVKE